MRRLFLLLLVYGAVNAIAYSCLLPMWEGFDEAYHYGYVSFLSTHLQLPVLGKGALSQEIWHSYRYQPVSHYLQGFTGAPLNFSDYFKMPAEERAKLRQQLDSLPPNEKFESQADHPNYELNQSPLPYFYMAAIDRVLLNQPITTRVLWIRLFTSILAVLMIWHSVVLLSRELELPDVCASAALFCIFSSQMLYATVCHVCNDGLAVALMGYLIWTSIRAHRTASPRDCLLLGLAISAALLSKSYYLFLVPMPILWLVRRANLKGWLCFSAPLALLAGPWFARNVILYHDFSGTSEKTAGIGPRQLADAVLQLPWIDSINSMAHSSLWTGNNSFTTFSATTIDAMLLLVAAATILYCVHARRQIAEWTVITASVLFWCALLVVTITFFAASKHEVTGAVPWYAQVLLAPVMLLMFLGMSRAPRWGRILASAFVALWGYVLIATYLVKFVPLYAGVPISGKSWRELPAWYWNQWSETARTLGEVCPASSWTILFFAGLAVVMCIGLGVHMTQPRMVVLQRLVSDRRRK